MISAKLRKSAVEVSSYIVELIETERKENADFREEVRKDFAELRERMAVHEAQHAAGRHFRQIAAGVLGTAIAVASIVVPILLK